MKTKRFKLRSFTPKSADLPHETQAQVILDSCARNKEGDFCITAKMITENEVDEQLDALVRELEGIRNRAKRLLRKQSANQSSETTD